MSDSLLKIGLSLPFAETAALANIDYIPECFELIELPGEAVFDAHTLKETASCWQEFECFNFRDLIPSALTCQLSPENRMIIQEYKKKLRDLLERAHAGKAEYAGLDPDWESLAADPGKLAVFNDILRSTAGDRAYYNIDLYITVRLPGSGSCSVHESIALLHKLSNYRVKLALDIYPHELLKSQIDWQELLNKFRFETGCIRLCYQSELGNKLLFQHIEKIVKPLHKWQKEVHIYLAPSGRANYDELAETAKSIICEANEQ